MRWAVIGTGRISRIVVPDIQSLPGELIVAVHSRTATCAETFATDFGIHTWTNDLDLILADDRVEIVYIATPFSTHADLASRSIRAGKHVLVDKPIATTAAEATELFRLAAEHGVFLMEAMWMKFNPAFERLQRELASGVIGEVRSLRANFAIPFPQDGGSRRDPSRSGSTLLDQGIYPVTLAHSIFGIPDMLTASGTVRPDGVDTAEHFTLEYKGGRFAQCAAGMTEYADPTASVSGTAGWIAIPAPIWAPPVLGLHTYCGVDPWRPKSLVLTTEGNGYLPMIRNVAEAIAAGRIEHPRHNSADTIAVFTTLDRIRAAIAATRDKFNRRGVSQ